MKNNEGYMNRYEHESDSERSAKRRAIHEQEVAKQIAYNLEQRRIRKEQWWANQNTEKSLTSFVLNEVITRGLLEGEDN